MRPELGASALAAAALAGLAIAACGSAAPTPRACSLTLRYVESAAGTSDVFASFRLRNTSTRSCPIDRYPAVRLLSPRGQRLRQPERHGFPYTAPHPLRVLRGEATAYFELTFAPLTPSGAKRCAPAATEAAVTFSSAATARTSLPTRLSKEREPINPCSGAGFSVTRVARER